MLAWFGTQWPAVIQALAAVLSLVVIWVYSHKNAEIVARQEAHLEAERHRQQEHEEMMKRKVASVLVKRLAKISAALDGIRSKQAASMFVMDPMDKGLPDEMIVTYLDAGLTFRVFTLFDQLRDDRVNVGGVLEQSGDADTVEIFADVAMRRHAEVYALLLDLASIANIGILEEEPAPEV